MESVSILGTTFMGKSRYLISVGATYTNLISIFRLFIQPMISKFAVSNERNSQ